ncbi:hypothetical protein ABPG75_011995 [Micractinium tetrahymenae]
MDGRMPRPASVPRAATVASLPDDLLGRILVLALAGREDTQWPALALVSCRWRGVLFAEPSLWRSFRLLPPSEGWSQRVLQPHYGEDSDDEPDEEEVHHLADWLARRHFRLRGVAPPVKSFVLGDEEAPGHGAATSVDAAAAAAGLDLGDFVGLLLPSCLTRLHLEWEPWLPRLGLARFTGLTSLALRCQRMAAPEPEAALRALPRLQSLHLATCAVSPELLASIGRLGSQLTHLWLASYVAPPPLAPLTQLRCLRELFVGEDPGVDRYSHAVVPAAAVPKVLHQAVPEPRQHWPELQRFQYSSGCSRHSLPAKLAGCLVANCCITAADLAADLPEGYSGAAVELGGTSRMPSLQALLAALLPPGQPPGSLILRSCSLPAAALRECPVLSTLSDLRLVYFDAEDGLGEREVAALLAAAPRMRRLLLSRACMGSRPPACLLQKRGLTRLSLLECQLEELPAGPFLDTTSLRRLELAGNPELDLTREAVTDVLLGLPALESLTQPCQP